MDFLISLLAVYAVTLMLTESDGPDDIFAELRQRDDMKVLRCFLCTSVWVGAFFALFIAANFLNWILLSLALAGGAVLIDRWTA